MVTMIWITHLKQQKLFHLKPSFSISVTIIREITHLQIILLCVKKGLLYSLQIFNVAIIDTSYVEVRKKTLRREGSGMENMDCTWLKMVRQRDISRMCPEVLVNRLLPNVAHCLIIFMKSSVQSLVTIGSQIIYLLLLKQPVSYHNSGDHYNSVHCRAAVTLDASIVRYMTVSKSRVETITSQPSAPLKCVTKNFHSSNQYSSSAL